METPTYFRFSGNNENMVPRSSLYKQDGNHLPILVLAWTYKVRYLISSLVGNDACMLLNSVHISAVNIGRCLEWTQF